MTFTLSCSLISPPIGGDSNPAASTGSSFIGSAYVDTNRDGELDTSDAPLEGAVFTAAGMQQETGADGGASIPVPEGLEGQVTANMTPPEGGYYTLISPSEVTLQPGTQENAEFLFAVSAQPSVEKPIGAPNPGSIDIDLDYCVTEGGVILNMDLYHPLTAAGPVPVVIYIHGGGWTGGDKSDGAGMLFTPPLRENGYLVAAINYRLAPTHTFPGPIEDVKCAVRHLRANADKYNLDPDRIGALGGSAGGHLASLLGLTDESAGWEVGQYEDQSSHVDAVVDLWGPADLSQFDYNPSREVYKMVFGAENPQDPILETYSPVTYISPGDPPFLIIQGEDDETVPPSQSQIFYDRLQAAGVPAELVMVKNAAHGLRPTSGRLKPGLTELRQMVVEFFDQHLK
jgi:acetyl esterase/lipase